jgi:Holliday junction DNA helicase RuvA
LLRTIKGRVLSKSQKPNKLTVDVQGLGFEILVSQNTLQNSKENNDCKVFTHMQIAPDAVKLFGFLEEWELMFFELLTEIKGIGPKSALSIVDNVNLTTLIEAVVQEKTKYFADVPGVGPKTAERIFFELKPKIKHLERLSASQGSNNENDDSSSLYAVIELLESLGYEKKDVSKALATNYTLGNKLDKPSLIKACINWLNQQ